jgi:hypothetical protein
VFTAQEDFRLTDFNLTQSVLFTELEKRPVVLAFDQALGSSDGGAILLSAANRRFDDGLIESLSRSLRDLRQQGKVDHQMAELMRQRIYGLACGYEDANDAARIGADPMHKLLAGRDPLKGLDLASQPTLSRFENSVTLHSLFTMGMTLAESVIMRHGKRRNGHARLVTIDMDPTDAATYGAQQLSFFNTHYDNHCYLPMLGFVSFDNEADQYLCAAVLRPGNVGAATGAVGLLRRLIQLVRASFPKASIRVRLDGGFASPAVFDFLDASPKVYYVVAMASNAVLDRHAAEALDVARLAAELTDETEHVYGDTSYAAKSWKHERRVIFKAEVVRAENKEPRDNPRFVVTNMKQTPQWLYEEVYCQRGDIENRIKELKALDVDRTSCTNFWANQLRVLMAAAAYVLLQEIRLNAALTSLVRAQVWTLRERLLKLGARVSASVRRIVVHLPESFPWRNDFQKIAAALGATAG